MSTRREFRSLSDLARCVACAAVVLCAGCGSQLSISIVLAADMQGIPPNAIKIDVIEKGKTTGKDFGPFAVTSIPDGQLAPVPPGTPFFIDVIGCQAATDTSCPDGHPEKFIARGCSKFMTVAKDADQVNVPITLHNIAAPEAKECPPAS